MSLDKKVRFEYDNLKREEAERIIQEASFEVIQMKYNDGLFGQYKGPEQDYQDHVKAVESKGIRLVYRESKAKEAI